MNELKIVYVKTFNYLVELLAWKNDKENIEKLKKKYPSPQYEIKYNIGTYKIFIYDTFHDNILKELDDLIKEEK